MCKHIHSRAGGSQCDQKVFLILCDRWKIVCVFVCQHKHVRFLVLVDDGNRRVLVVSGGS